MSKQHRSPKQEHPEIDYGTLAVPEIHLKKRPRPDDSSNDEEVAYENLAVPEIHLKHRDR